MLIALFILSRGFNAQVFWNRDRLYPCLGKFRVGKENSNGYRLLQFSRYNNLVIANTVIDSKIAHNLTLYSYDGRTSKLTNYVIVNRQLTWWHDTRVYSNDYIDGKSKDHHLVTSRVNPEVKFREGHYLPRIYDIGTLQNENLRENFQEQWSIQLDSLRFLSDKYWLAILTQKYLSDYLLKERRM